MEGDDPSALLISNTRFLTWEPTPPFSIVSISVAGVSWHEVRDRYGCPVSIFGASHLASESVRRELRKRGIMTDDLDARLAALHPENEKAPAL